MGQHHRAKLGPAGRAQLVSVINAAGDRAPVVVALAAGHRARETFGPVGVGSQLASASFSWPDVARARGADLSGASTYQPRAGASGGDRGVSALDRARGVGASWDLTPSPG